LKACLEAGTHYLDISGEMQFVEKMQLLYHKEAEDKGVYILCSGGSIPPEMGLNFLQDNFNGMLYFTLLV